MPDTPLTGQQLAERIAEVIRPRMLIGLQDAELHDGPGTERINEWADSIANWAAEVARAELDRLRAENVRLSGAWYSARLRDQRLSDEAQRLRAERDQARAGLATAQQQAEAAHCRLHHIEARVEQIASGDDPCAIGLDLIPWLDGPLHPDHLAAYQAATAEQAGDEWVRCSGLHCPNGEWFRFAAERGWQHGHMDTWSCPTCAAPTPGES